MKSQSDTEVFNIDNKSNERVSISIKRIGIKSGIVALGVLSIPIITVASV
jgi:hypothetical protein